VKRYREKISFPLDFRVRFHILSLIRETDIIYLFISRYDATQKKQALGNQYRGKEQTGLYQTAFDQFSEKLKDYDDFQKSYGFKILRG
jgi:hypothetical protein